MTTTEHLLTDDQMERLAQHLNGSCESVHDAVRIAVDSFGLEETDALLDEILERLVDEEVQCCTGCSWWMETSELNEDANGELVCVDCE